MDMCFLKRFLFVPILFVLQSQVAFAGNINQWLVGLGAGVAGRSLSSFTHISNGTPVPAPYNSDTFSINTHHAPVVTFFGGYQWNRSSSSIPYYNVTFHYEHQFDANISGNVQQYALPQFTNYNYSMNLTSDIFSIIGKVGLVQYKLLIPYLSAGLGLAFNHINNYSETPTFNDGSERVSPQYGGRSNNNFAYTLGAGVDIASCKNTMVSLAYEYWNLGNITTSSGSGSWSGTRLNLGTLKSNTLLATLTFFLE
jgi:opacity protein-like surface antigen